MLARKSSIAALTATTLNWLVMDRPATRIMENRRKPGKSRKQQKRLGLGSTGRSSSLHDMTYHQEIIRYLPAQATAAAFIPIMLLAFKKLTMRQTVHKQRELRERVIALNVFIGSMKEFPDVGEHHAACLQDGLRQRGLILTELASLTARKSRTLLSRSGARRLLLLYAPSGPFAWALHWIFFFFLIAALTGLIRSLFHVAYLRPSILVPLVIGDFVIVILVRVASFYVDRPVQAATIV
jgi:hypothetical protein